MLIRMHGGSGPVLTAGLILLSCNRSSFPVACKIAAQLTCAAPRSVWLKGEVNADPTMLSQYSSFLIDLPATMQALRTQIGKEERDDCKVTR